MKTFKFRNATITIEMTGYGQYSLKGLGTSVHTTASDIYDWCDDDSNKTKHEDAKKEAYMLLKANK